MVNFRLDVGGFTKVVHSRLSSVGLYIHAVLASMPWCLRSSLSSWTEELYCIRPSIARFVAKILMGPMPHDQWRWNCEVQSPRLSLCQPSRK